MAKCAGCGKFLSPSGAATCSTCPLKFHKGCVGLPDCTAISSTWACPECKRNQRKGDNSSTPVKSVSGVTTPPPPLKNDETPLSCPPVVAAPPAEDTEIQAMRREFAAYITEQRDFRKDVRASLANLVGRIDSIERRLEVVELRDLTVPTSSAEVTELQQTVDLLKLELNDRDQENLLSDLDIGHLPEEKGENVLHTVTVLASKLGVTIEDRDIVFAERVGAVDASGGDSSARARPRRVVVRLARRDLRDQLLSAARVRRNFSSADIGLVGPPCRVYINERLTRTNRQLFHRVREECRKRQWRYSWTKRGRIFARQADGKQAFSFRSEADFSKVFGTGVV